MGCHFLLQRLFRTQGLKLHLLCVLRWQVDSLPPSHLGYPPRSRARTSFNTSRLQGRGLCHSQWPQQPSVVGAWGVRGRVPPTSCRGHLALDRGGGPRRGRQPCCKAAPALRSFPARGLSAHPRRCGGLWGTAPGGSGLSQTLPLELSSGPRPGPAFPRAVTQ